MISLERVVIWLHIRRPYLTLTSLIFHVSEGRSAVIHDTNIKLVVQQSQKLTCLFNFDSEYERRLEVPQMSNSYF